MTNLSLSLSLSLQLIIFSVKTHPLRPDFTQCVDFDFFPEKWQEQTYTISSLIFLYFLPLVFIIFCYSAISCIIIKRSRIDDEKSLACKGKCFLQMPLCVLFSLRNFHWEDTTQIKFILVTGVCLYFTLVNIFFSNGTFVCSFLAKFTQHEGQREGKKVVVKGMRDRWWVKYMNEPCLPVKNGRIRTWIWPKLGYFQTPADTSLTRWFWKGESFLFLILSFKVLLFAIGGSLYSARAFCPVHPI